MNYYFLSDPQSKKFSRLDRDRRSPYWDLKDEDLFRNDQYNLKSPFSLICEQGKELTDILWPYDINPQCISNRLLNLLESSEIKGYITYPVSIKTTMEREISGYFGFYISGNKVDLDLSKSRIIEKPRNEKTGRIVKVYIDLAINYSQVNDRDIFLIDIGILVSEKLYWILVDNNIQNIKLEKFIDKELDLLVAKYLHK